MPNFTWLTFAQAKTYLSNRLADPGKVFWLDAELGLYLTEALQVWNSLTWIWNKEFEFMAEGNQGPWYNLANLISPGPPVTPSPRSRTTTDVDVYTQMQYQLLEPPTGGTWTGTTQFTISDLSLALQRRRDEFIQYSGCSFQELDLPAVVGIRRTIIPDNVLEVRRCRYVPDPTKGIPVTLYRSDKLAQGYFRPEFWQADTPKDPQSYTVITEPPLMMDVDRPPAIPGTYNLLALMAGPVFAPPAPTLLGIPNDFAWVAKYGALYDLLSSESEAKDVARAQYCLGRYRDGLTLSQKAQWLAVANINQVAIDTNSVEQMDKFAVEWQEGSILNCVVVGGMDYVAICPVPTGTEQIKGIVLTLTANAPITSEGDFVQVSRDTFDVILDYAQHIASFKMGGEEFSRTMELYKNFVKTAMEQNVRIKNLGIFRDLLINEGHRQEEYQPRFEE